jgi:hypothetical protein
MSIKAKKKICKGNYRSNHFEGCGQELYIFKYGLCQKCFNKWLTETNEGSDYLKKQIIPKAKKEVKQKEKKRTQQKKEQLKTHKDWLKDLQKVFNKYIRLRDKNQPCISCGVSVDWKKSNASHFFSVGKVPQLRFNEDNVHKSCVRCNKHLHGNLIEYSIRLPKRIGQKRYEKLLDSRNTTLKLSIPEIKELIKKYKEKIKNLL